jgi:hypothetical protein
MKTLFTGLALIAGLSYTTSTLAQDGTATVKPNKREMAGERVEQNTEHLTQLCGLNAEQTARVDKINTEFTKELKGLQGLAPEERSAKKKELFARRDAELKKAMTPEQYDTMMKDRQTRKLERASAPKQGPKKVTTQ